MSHMASKHKDSSVLEDFLFQSPLCQNDSLGPVIFIICKNSVFIDFLDCICVCRHMYTLTTCMSGYHVHF